MIEKDKNISIRQDIQNIIFRATRIKQITTLINQYIVYTQQSYNNFCKDTFKDLIQFQNKISKACRYQPQKTSMIIKLSTLYRQFPSKIQNYSEVNLNKIHSIAKLQDIFRYQNLIKKKAQIFFSQLKNYNNSIIDYQIIYDSYSHNCTNLDQIISRFRSYSDPMKFYDKSITSQYQERLQSSLNQSNIQQTKVITQLQLLDSKRRILDQTIKQIRQIMTHLINQSLKLIESITVLLSDPNKDEPKALTLGNSFGKANENENNSEFYDAEFQRLNTFTNFIDQGNQILADFNDIFKDHKGGKISQHLISDHKLFLMRVQSIKKKKQKSFQECLSLHEAVLQMFETQINNYKQFQKKFKLRQKQLFGLTGKQTLRKDMQIMFSPKTYKLYQLCFYIVQIPKRCFQQINIWLVDNFMNIKQIVENKKDSINRFNKFYQQIVGQHLKEKNKFQASGGYNDQITQNYRASLVSSLDQFKFIFKQLESKEKEKDKFVGEKLKNMGEFLLKQYNICKITNILQLNKDKLEALKSFKIIAEVMQIFKNDPLFSILYDEYFSISLQKNFVSKINKKQYDEAQAILKQKDKIAKKMLKKQKGCCGLIKAKPIQSEVISTHKCYIYNLEKNNRSGTLKILKQGLTFQDSVWACFTQKVHILIPKSDIHSVESKNLSHGQINQGVCVFTEKGPLIFMSKNFDELFTALQKTYGQTYRKSIVVDRKTFDKNDKNDSTESGGPKTNSVLVSYNKQHKIFSQEPVCLNPALSKMSGSGSLDKKLKGPNMYLSAVSTNSEQFKGVKPRKKSQSQLKEENKIRNSYNSIIQKYNKQNFWDQKFRYLVKTYKSDQRKDYQFKDIQNHNFFILKELKRYQVKQTTSGLILQICYEWKITYPNTSLHSFKHGQKITIDLNLNPPMITIVQYPHLKEQIFNRHFFYEKVKQMNTKIWKYIVKNMSQGFIYESMIQKQYCEIDDSECRIADDMKQLGVSYPQQLQIKGSRICSYPYQNRKSTSIDKIELRNSNIYGSKNFGKSTALDSAGGLLKVSQI